MVNGVSKKIFLIASAGIMILFFTTTHKKEMNKELTYIITDTKTPDSYDPLDADSANNLPVMRMLYASILQVDVKNELHSLILEEYNYTENKIFFKIKPNLHYSDGEDITAEDITISILRVALKNPNFPIIKDIVGINEWRKSNSPLTIRPSGVIINGNEITILLTKKFANPLFRFCLELFSVIPKKCLNLNSNELNCKTPPSSGFYNIETISPNKIFFKRRDGFINTEAKYATITFKYKTFEQQCNEELQRDEIISSNETALTNFECKNIKPNQIKWLPTSRFGMMLFNPNLPPFDKKKNRRFFADKVRDELSRNSSNVITEASIFTKILPGYLSMQELKNSEEQLINQESDFKDAEIYIPNFSTAVNQQTIASIIKVASQLEMKLKFLNNKPGADGITKFITNKASLMIGSSGFWAQDPIGDLSMFFSRNLHKPLYFTWDDEKLQSLILKIENESESSKVKLLMEELNRHLYSESLIAPLVHFRRLYITNSNIESLNIPQAVTSPAPWHLIQEE